MIETLSKAVGPSPEVAGKAGKTENNISQA
jgi:hypothetical protein